jgi:glycosyltransferase involved in cell wall biosynthesis
MNIIILCRVYWTSGSTKIAIQEAYELEKMGHNVTLFFLRKSNKYNEYDVPNNLDIRFFQQNKNSILRPLFTYITLKFRPDRDGESTVDYDLISKFSKYSKAFNPELIICHDQWAGIAGYKVKRRFKVPYVVILHEKPPQYDKIGFIGKFAKNLEKKVLFNAECLFSMTDGIKKSYETNQKISSKLLPYATIKHQFIKFEIKKNLLISVSMWDKGRNPQIYIELMKQVPNYILHMVGNWREEQNYLEFMKKLDNSGLRDRIIVLRNINERELNKEYRDAKFSIRFSFGEVGGGMSVFEALSNGTPSIVNKKLGSSDLVEEFNIGTVIDDNSLASLNFDKIINFIQTVDNKINYDEIQNRMVNVLDELSWRKHCEILMQAFHGDMVA